MPGNEIDKDVVGADAGARAGTTKGLRKRNRHGCSRDRPAGSAGDGSDEL